MDNIESIFACKIDGDKIIIDPLKMNILVTKKQVQDGDDDYVYTLNKVIVKIGNDTHEIWTDINSFELKLSSVVDKYVSKYGFKSYEFDQEKMKKLKSKLKPYFSVV